MGGTTVLPEGPDISLRACWRRERARSSEVGVVGEVALVAGGGDRCMPVTKWIGRYECCQAAGRDVVYGREWGRMRGEEREMRKEGNGGKREAEDGG